MNEDALNFFQNMANDPNCTQNSCKMAKNSDFSNIDAEFVLNYASKESSILDLGAGTGLLINKIYDKVSKIVAVEPFVKFTDYIVKSDNINIINQTINDYDTDEKFDFVTLFGVMQYFSEQEAVDIYNKIRKYLKPKGKIIIKNQFGTENDVNVQGYSEELGKEYFSQYRYLQKEVKILENTGFKNIEIFDIYPPECNRWQNTHFYAIVGGV